MIMQKSLFLLLITIISGILFWYFLQPASGRTVTIVSSLPHNVRRSEGQLRGLKLALVEAGGKVGNTNVQLLDWDDGEGDSWSPVREAENARSAIARGDVIAYYGPFNSGAAKVSLPILNKAGLLQVSGTVTWPGLTKPGFAVGEPAKFYPTGNRHFFRVTPTDAIQGPAAALFLRGLDKKTIAVLSDEGVFGIGAAKLFQQRAQDIGMNVVLQDIIHSDSVAPLLIDKIIGLNPDAVYVGSDDNKGLQAVYLGLRTKGYKGIFIGAEFRGTNFEKILLADDPNVYTTTPGVSARDQHNVRATRFLQQYARLYHEDPEAYAVFAYESMRMILEAIRTSDGSRSGVLQAFRNIKDFDTVFGLANFDSRGDIENNMTSVFHFAQDKWNFARVIENNI